MPSLIIYRSFLKFFMYFLQKNTWAVFITQPFLFSIKRLPTWNMRDGGVALRFNRYADPRLLLRKSFGGSDPD